MIAKDVLAAEKHLKLDVRASFSDGAEPLPWIFIQEAEAGIESRASPHLKRVIARLIKKRGDAQNLIRGQTGRNQRLRTIAESRINDFYSHWNYLYKYA